MTKHSKWMRSCAAAFFLLGAVSCGSSNDGEAQPGASTAGQSSVPAGTGGIPAGTAGRTSSGASASTAAGAGASSASAGSAASTAGRGASAAGGGAGSAANAGSGTVAGTSAAGSAGTAAGVAGSGAGSSAAAGGGAAGSSGVTGGPLKYTSAFTMGMIIPPKNKCPMVSAIVGGGTGDNKSPALSWSGGPADAKSYAIVLFDTRYNMLHWVLWDIPATVHELPEGLASGYELSMPMGAHQVSNMGMDKHAYYGPCSSGSSAGTYEYRLYALKEAKLQLTESSTGREAQMAVEAAKLDSVVWSGKPE
jgi:Raf kinase inhibitor-like YbhB/YbcL family protein